ncbi:hypothetical protein CLH39_10110 [Alcaligenes faecalis]|nr:hypothetical protein CLH39_10110 [Alcaligenes faecalis]
MLTIREENRMKLARSGTGDTRLNAQHRSVSNLELKAGKKSYFQEIAIAPIISGLLSITYNNKG